jgi:hypothetical protein
MKSIRPPLIDTLRSGLLAGLAGGLAEVVWVGLYGASTGTPVAAVARGVVASLAPSAAAAPGAVALGIAIHMVMALALGVALAFALGLVFRRGDRRRFEAACVMAALAAVWGINFLVALPRINPGFVHLLPYGVTLTSKLLFGAAAVGLFRAQGIRARRSGR